jgi:hypothetical protein
LRLLTLLRCFSPDVIGISKNDVLESDRQQNVWVFGFLASRSVHLLAVVNIDSFFMPLVNEKKRRCSELVLFCVF